MALRMIFEVETNPDICTQGKTRLDNLNSLLNSWPPGCRGESKERNIIQIIEVLGANYGYGLIAQLAEGIKQIQCYEKKKASANFKRQRFKELGWPLPDNFEESAKENK